MELEVREISNGKKKDLDWIKTTLGQPFSFLKNLKMGGVGSPKLFYSAGSEALDLVKTKYNAKNYSNLEMYPNGILLRMSLNTFVYALPIPYSMLGAMQLTVSKENEGEYELKLEVRGFNSLYFKAKKESLNSSISYFTRTDFAGRFSILR